MSENMEGAMLGSEKEVRGLGERIVLPAQAAEEV